MMRKQLEKDREQNIIAAEPRAKIPTGDYEAVCHDVKTKPCQGGSLRIFIEFRIHGGEYHGSELFMCCPKPNGKLRERHKLHTQMSLALGRRPHKGERFNKGIFVGKMFKVKVRDTRKKFTDSNRLMPDFLQYSVIDGILEVLVGG